LRTTFLPFALPDIGEEEIKAVDEVLRSGWITTGPQTQAFESEFAAAVGAQHAIAVNSCTAALHLALEALGVSSGDEVLTSTITFTATAEVVEYLGGRTRFLDIEPTTLMLTPESVRQAVVRLYEVRAGGWFAKDTGGRLRALVPVHFGGQMCDMEGLQALSREFGIAIVDDAAHAYPASRSGVPVGQLGDATAFSFYATKTISTGEGGMLTTSNPAIAERARLMALHGISRDAWKRYTAEGSWSYEVLSAGFKYNMTDIAAALGRVQLRRARAMAQRRERVASRYAVAFASLSEVEPPTCLPGVEHAWHLYSLRLHLDQLRIDRAQFIDELRSLHIGASVHFIPLHLQPFYANRYGYRPSDFPVAGREYPRLISLPIYSRMTDGDVDSVIHAVTDIVRRFRR
jgi:perosamine synthetase